MQSEIEIMNDESERKMPEWSDHNHEPHLNPMPSIMMYTMSALERNTARCNAIDVYADFCYVLFT